MNYLNLDPKKTEATVEQLNVLLADYHIYYQKLRNFHWNVVGENFFDLHEKFEEMYNDTLIKIKESPSETADLEMIELLLEDHGKLLTQMRKTVNFADEGGDEGTIDLLGAYIRELEKTSWMLDSWRMTKSETHKKS